MGSFKTTFTDHRLALKRYDLVNYVLYLDLVIRTNLFASKIYLSRESGSIFDGQTVTNLLNNSFVNEESQYFFQNHLENK